MQSKLRFVQNQRVDLPDAERIHDEADAGLREHGRVLANTAEPGLTLSAVNSAPKAMILSGWTVRVNPASDQQLLITPGVAICAQVIDGVESFGQVTVAAAERLLVMSGGLETKGLWARFIYLAGTSENRARWRPDFSPAREQVFIHTTAYLADCELSLSHGGADTPPTANAGWFKIAEVDYGDGAVVAADIVDRRSLFFEGDAGGSANPATTWTIPAADRGASRGTIGARSFWGWVQRVNLRLEELGGRSWYDDADAPNGESVRAAASTITVGASTADRPHAILSTTPTAAEVGAAFLGNTGADARGGVEFVTHANGSRQGYAVDCSAGPVSLSVAHGREITGNATFTKANGDVNPMFKTSSAGAGMRGRVRGLNFSETVGGLSLWLCENTADDILFEDCVFTAQDTGLVDVVKLNSAGRYTFINCKFVGADTSTTILVLVSMANCRVTFIGCHFTTAAVGVRVAAAGTNVAIVGCVFTGLDKGVVSTQDGVSLYGCDFSTITTYDTDLQSEADYAPGTMAHGAQFTGEVSARTFRASGGVVKTGVGTATLTLGATVSGDDGAGAKPVAAFKLYTFVGDSAAGKRLEYIASGGGAPSRFALLDGASPTVPTLPLHVHSLLVGEDATDTRAVLSAGTTPRAWGAGRYDNTVPASATQEGGGTRYDGGLVTVVYTPIAAEHAWVVSGLGMENNKYSVVPHLSLVLDNASHLLEADDGYTYGVTVVAKTDNGFTLIPWCRDKNGLRVVMDDDLLDTDVASYDVQFQVFGHHAYM